MSMAWSSTLCPAESAPTASKDAAPATPPGSRTPRRLTRDSVTGLRARALSRVEHAWNWCPHRRYVADTNRDAGPLAPYEACAALKDGCALHDAAACARNSFCAWDGRTEVCAAAAASGPGKKPSPAMTRIAEDGRRDAADACDGPIVTERVVVTRAPEDARMFFHWWRFFGARRERDPPRPRGRRPRHAHACSRATRRRRSCPTWAC